MAELPEITLDNSARSLLTNNQQAAPPQLDRTPAKPRLSIRVDITEDRARAMKGGIMRTFQKDPESQFKFVAHFMTHDSGAYMTYEEACVILDELSLPEIGQIVNQIFEEVQEVAAPKK